MQDLAIGLPGPAAYALVAEFHIFGYFAEWLEVSQTDYGYATVKGVFWPLRDWIALSPLRFGHTDRRPANPSAPGGEYNGAANH